MPTKKAVAKDTAVKKEVRQVGRPPLDEGGIPIPSTIQLRSEIIKGARRFGTTIGNYTTRVLGTLAGNMDQAYASSIDREVSNSNKKKKRATA